MKYQIITAEIEQLRNCSTKNAFKKIISALDEEWKELIKFYLTDCYVMDLYTRKLDDKTNLLSKREVFYDVVNNPLILDGDCHFDNNLIKNFCTGMANFILKNISEIKKVIKERKEKELKKKTERENLKGKELIIGKDGK